MGYLTARLLQAETDAIADLLVSAWEQAAPAEPSPALTIDDPALAQSASLASFYFNGPAAAIGQGNELLSGRSFDQRLNVTASAPTDYTTADASGSRLTYGEDSFVVGGIHADFDAEGPFTTDYVLNNLRWDGPTPGVGATVSWSFATQNYSTATNSYSGYVSFDSLFPSQYYGVVRSAFSAWAAVANIVFTEVSDPASFNTATLPNIRIGTDFIDGTPSGSNTLARTSYWSQSGSPLGTLSTTEIYVDPDTYSTHASSLYSIMLHEIGHALGLGHSLIQSAVMYSESNAQNAAGILTSDDIAAIRYLYGTGGGSPPPPPPPPPPSPPTLPPPPPPPPAVVDDYPATTATAGAVPVNGSVTGTINFVGDADWFRVNLTAGVAYRILLNGDTLGDPYLQVRNPSGTLLNNFDDDYLNFTLNSRAIFVAPTSGQYFLTATHWPGSSVIGTYQLTVSTLLTVPGTATDNTLGGSTSYEYVNAGNGNDFIFATAGDDVYDGGIGIDTVSYQNAPSGLTLNINPAVRFPMENGFLEATTGIAGWAAHGFRSIENIIGTPFNDVITMDSGNNVLDGYGGIDTLDGGAGNDTYIIRNLSTTILDSAGTDEAIVYVGGYVLDGNLENLTIGSGLNILVAQGNGVDNRITGNEFNNELYGLAGNDVLNAGAGDDRLEGGLGIDTLYGGAGNDAMFGHDGIDRLEGEAGDDLMFGGEGDDVIIGGAGADRAWGENGVDLMFGGADNDILLGEFGNDRLFGESGNDDLFGGVGDDQLLGEAGNDRLFGDVGADEFFGGDGLDLILGEDGADRAYGGNDADDIFGQSGGDLLLGEAGDDRIWGGTENDLIFGQDGNDLLQGEQDNDRLFGGFGNDLLFGQDGNDELQGEQDNDRLFGGNGDDILFGQAGVDELQGEDGNDRLFGGDGNDVLWGGAGNDELQGEAGADRYTFSNGSGADTIYGFQDTVDLLDLRFYSGATIGNTVIAQVGGNTLATFIGGSSVTLVGFTAANLTAADFLFA